MKKRIFAVAAALCLMAGTGAFAQEAKPAAAPKERPTVEQMAQRMTERMQKELKLTDAQAKEVYNLNFQQIKEMQAMREKMREARKAEAEKDEVDPDDRTVRAVVADAGSAARPARSWSPDDEKRRPSRRRQGVL